MSNSSSVPQNLPPLGRILITTFFEDSTLRVQLPPVRGKAIREASTRGAMAFYVPQIPAEKIPRAGDFGSALVMSGGLMAGGGAVQLGAAALSSIGATSNGLVAMLGGIPAHTHYPAMRALTNAQAQYHPAKEVIERLLARAQRPGWSTLALTTDREPAAVDTILELYDGERSLRGDGPINPPMQFRMGFKCSLLRPADHRVLHVFRVAYTSERRSFVQWGANDAALFRKEVEKGLASITEQIVAYLAARINTAISGMTPLVVRV